MPTLRCCEIKRSYCTGGTGVLSVELHAHVASLLLLSLKHAEHARRLLLRRHFVVFESGEDNLVFT
jgi:hypothetical protein